MLTAYKTIEGIEAYEAQALKQPQVAIRIRHHFAGGIYERECFIETGSVITGKVHRTEHLAKLTAGTMRILSGYGHGVFTGPVSFKGFPGDKKMAYAETDCVFSTFHYVGDERCLETIEKMLVSDSMAAALEEIGKKLYIAMEDKK